MNNKYITSLVLLIILLTGCTKPPEVSETSNEPITPWESPYQKKYSGDHVFTKNFAAGEFTIKPLFEYNVAARIVGKKNYSAFSWQGKVAPMDLALAWEELSKPNYVKFVSFSQRNRWYYFKLRSGAPFDLGFVYNRSSNNHIIPHNENVLRALKRLRKNDIINLTGYLVRLDGKWNGRKVWWKSSTSRNDTGDGSCEVIYVTSVKKGNKLYK